MKIAFFVGIFFPKPGGVQIQTHNIANTLVKMDNEVDLYLLNKSNQKNNLYKIFVINKLIISLFFYLKYYLKINLSIFLRMYLKYFLKIEKYDLFHFHFLNHKMIYLIENLKYFDKKIIVTFHGADIQVRKEINYGFRINKLYEKLLKNIILDIDYFFSISKSIKRDIINMGVDEKKIYLSPNSVCLEKINQFKNQTKSIKEKIQIITVTRYAKSTKGLDLIPKISEILLKNNINFEWSLVGKDMDKVKELKDMKKYNNNFKFYGNIQNFEEEIFPNSELIKIYKCNHLYVGLSRIESFGISMLEALACGLPVLSFNIKGANELIVNNYNGKLVDKYCATEMAENIISYQKNEIYEKQKKNTLESVLKFDLKKVATSVKNFYKTIKYLRD